MPEPPPERTRLALPRLARELRTIAAMIAIFCRAHHRGGDGPCTSCASLLDYAARRLDRCPFRENKPTCTKCVVHCYSDERRNEIKAVMRFAGPRMLLRHPYLALAHIRDGRRPVPNLAGRRPPSAAERDADV